MRGRALGTAQNDENAGLMAPPESRIWKFRASIATALVLLAVVVLAALVGTGVMQGGAPGIGDAASRGGAALATEGVASPVVDASSSTVRAQSSPSRSSAIEAPRPTAAFKDATIETPRPATAAKKDDRTPFPTVRAGEPPVVYAYEIVRAHPHDENAFTQGLTYAAPDALYESTGSVGGSSTVRVVDLKTCAVRKKTTLPTRSFAEGLAVDGDGKIAVLTWRSPLGYLLDPDTLNVTGTFRTSLSDGWVLTNDPAGDGTLIATDASDALKFLKTSGGGGGGGATTTTTTIKSTTIKDGDRAIRFANELETVRDEVWANVLERPCVARVNPSTGAVVGWIVFDDLKSKLPAGSSVEAGVMNGVAYDADGDRVFVTGKNWNALFEVKIIAKDGGVDAARRTCWPPASMPMYGYP